jgi:hypothetical protein
MHFRVEPALRAVAPASLALAQARVSLGSAYPAYELPFAPYCARSAIIGSTREARRAGR